MSAEPSSRSACGGTAGHPGASPRDTVSVAGSEIGVLVADDHPLVREGLAAIIGGQPGMRVVGCAANGQEAVELWRRHQPAVTLLDLRMPHLDGIGALRQIRELAGDARVIVLTTFDSDEDVYQALREGAKAYLLKEVSPEDLLECIGRVHAGGGYIPPAMAARLAIRIGGDELTCREREVLELLARGQENKAIAQALFISETTVKSHVKSIFAKLRVFNRTQAVATATRRGLIQL